MSAPDRLTDHQARSLLQAAADTVDVQPVPVRLPPQPPPSRWAWAGVAAATVAVVAATSLALTGQLGGVGPSFDPSPTPAPPRLTATPWNSVQLSDDQVPSVFGYDAESARQLLTDAGLDVTTAGLVSDDGCRYVGRALRTDPPLGSAVEPGGSATLLVGDTLGSCTKPELRSSQRVWQFVDFAAGRSTPPDFATNVTFSVNGDVVSLSARQAQDPSLWPTCSPDLALCPGNAADVVAASSRRVQRVGSGYAQPTLEVDSTRLTDAFTIDFPVDGIAFYPRWQVALDWRSTDQGTSEVLAGVDLSWLEEPSVGSGTSISVPLVTSLPLSEATSTLSRAGLAVREERVGGVPLGCWRDYYVLAQNPGPDAEAAAGTPIVLTTRLLPCGSDPADPLGIGAAFVAWARDDGGPPRFADEVGLYVGNRRLATVAGRDLAAGPEAWQVRLEGYAQRGPVFSAPQAIAGVDTVRSGGLVTGLVPRQGAFCPDAVAPPPADTGGLWAQTIETAEPASCNDALQVQLWVDADDRVSAVNLLLGSP